MRNKLTALKEEKYFLCISFFCIHALSVDSLCHLNYTLSVGKGSQHSLLILSMSFVFASNRISSQICQYHNILHCTVKNFPVK